jgi:16S rRNA (guanine1207-N2)-methyltransferase
VSDHYYSEKPDVASSPVTWTADLKGNTMKFTSDAGVFSKGGIDFGTKLLLEYIKLPNISGDIIDVGCGYGPIGLTIAKENHDRNIVMVDMNERAIQLSKENARKNHIENIAVLKSNLLQEVKGSKFSCVVSNPPIRAGKKVVHQLFEQASEQMLPGGELWIVIQKKQGAPSAIERLNELFDETEVVVKKKGYYIIKSKKC